MRICSTYLKYINVNNHKLIPIIDVKVIYKDEINPTSASTKNFKYLPSFIKSHTSITRFCMTNGYKDIDYAVPVSIAGWIFVNGLFIEYVKYYNSSCVHIYFNQFINDDDDEFQGCTAYNEREYIKTYTDFLKYLIEICDKTFEDYIIYDKNNIKTQFLLSYNSYIILKRNKNSPVTFPGANIFNQCIFLHKTIYYCIVLNNLYELPLFYKRNKMECSNEEKIKIMLGLKYKPIHNTPLITDACNLSTNNRYFY